MSATLDIVRSFSKSLSNELLETIRSQESVVRITLEEVESVLSSARSNFLSEISKIEMSYTEKVAVAYNERSDAVQDAVTTFENKMALMSKRIDEIRSMLTDEKEAQGCEPQS
jgi:hypothetical protein